jgi:hypothetical protein
MARRVGVAAFMAAILTACGPSFGPENIVVTDAQGFVRQARVLIEGKRLDPTKHAAWIDDAGLPASLRIQKVDLPWFARIAAQASVRQAVVHSDHLDLVLVRHPDGHGGARVWAARHRPHADKPTRYADIYFYISNDHPESPDNIP